MKKIISMVTAVVLCMLLLLPMTVSAASASATLTGPAAVREGDTVGSSSLAMPRVQAALNQSFALSS